MNSYSPRSQNDALPILLRRDEGYFCYVCSGDLSKTGHVVEHLDDDRMNYHITNLALACTSCNNKKPHNDTIKALALKKKKENESINYSSERVREKRIQVSPPTFRSEIDASELLFDITCQYVEEHIAADGQLDYRNAIPAIAYLSRITTGFGSPVSIRRHLDMLLSDEGPFMLISDDKKTKWIVRREEN